MSHRPFRDRRDAGRVLAGLLDEYRGRSDVIVLGLPRGGVPVAYKVAIALGARLARDWFTRHLHAGRPRPEAPEEGNSRS